MMCPAVSVVVPAQKRPVELRWVVAGARKQDYPGVIDVVVVYDRKEPDMSLMTDGDRSVSVLTNDRTPGRASARNTGIDSPYEVPDDADLDIGKLMSRSVQERINRAAHFVKRHGVVWP